MPATSPVWSKNCWLNSIAETGEYGVISSAYDTELFGHWWFEGAEWLKHVLRNSLNE